jgi:hypothetical protein
MSEVLTLEIPDDLAKRARAVASASQLRLEDAIVDWIRNALPELDVSTIPDAQIVQMCQLSLSDETQRELSELLARQREGGLPSADVQRLDSIMGEYRRGLVLKAKALAEAKRRGLNQGVNRNGA